ncbi:uncharacterized protein LOC132203726 [Neocloeon triangulifer]|uniref:uncharacterized protein LOC132203726 n=1 Tax=Neocloeon triangulifer TaxID=2078957 RepID=UPI00286F5838|nr:uncharacterized protein LOC132203726 [Neocloeon triangulifer]
MADDIRALVTLDELSKVVRQIHKGSEEVEILAYDVEKGTTSVQGFLSNILRVTIHLKVGGEKSTLKIVIKRKPLLESQLSMVDELEVFEHEIGIFHHCAPILRQRCPDLPAVNCYLTDSENEIIYMEDLKEQNYVALIRCIADLKENILTKEHVVLVMKTLAKFHSASVGIDWLKKFPKLFDEDVMFEKSDGTLMKKFVRQSAEKSLIPITEHHFKGDEYFLKSSKWFATEDFYQTLIAVCKPDPRGFNVLCHGDSWANNMMFKLDPSTGAPLKIKLIDFQLSRYTRASRDLMYFIYMCLNAGVRKEIEHEILEIYWNEFEKECYEKGIEMLDFTYEDFLADYEENKIFGLMMAAVMRPTIYVKGTFPDENEELSDDHINTMMDGGSETVDTLNEFKSNPEFREEMISIIEDIAKVYHKRF